jgi:hypothetical protein
MGHGRVAMAVAASSPDPARGQLSAAHEALWTVDQFGVLRAYDGLSDRALVTIDTNASVGPSTLVSGGDLMWMVRNDGLLTVDPVQARITHQATVAQARPLSLNTWYNAFDALWFAQPGRVSRIGPAAELTPIELPSDFTLTAMTATTRWLWLAGGTRLVRVDPRDLGTTVIDVPFVIGGIHDLLGTRDALVAVGRDRSEILALNDDTGMLRSSGQILADTLDSGLVDGSDADAGDLDADDVVWAAGTCGQVMKLTNIGRLMQVQKLRISEVSEDLSPTLALGSLWVADETRSELVRIDPRTVQVVARIPVDAADPDDPVFAIVAGKNSVWVTDVDGFMRVDPTTNRMLPRVPRPAGTFGLGGAVAASPR